MMCHANYSGYKSSCLLQVETFSLPYSAMRLLLLLVIVCSATAALLEDQHDLQRLMVSNAFRRQVEILMPDLPLLMQMAEVGQVQIVLNRKFEFKKKLLIMQTFQQLR